MGMLINRLREQFSYEDKNAGRIVCEGALWACVIQLTNPFYQLFVKQLGGSDFAISLVNAMPALLALVTLLPLSAYIDTVPNKKQLVAKTISIYTWILPFFAFSAFLGQFSIPVFILAIALFNVPLLAYTVSWQSFFSDVFSARQRVMPYSAREMVRNIIQGVCMLLGGFVLSYVCVTAEQKIAVYQVLFICAFAFALLQKKALCSVDDSHVVAHRQKRIKMLATYKMCYTELKKNKKFSLFLLLLFLFYFSWQMAWPLFFIYVVEYAGANEFLKNMFDIVGVVAFAFTATYWGKYIQKKGSQKATVIGLYTAALSPGWLVLTSSNIGMFINYIFGGLFSPAFQLGFFNDMLEQLPEENKTFNIGIYNTVIQLSAFISPLVGVAIYKATDIYFVMMLSSVLRGAAATLFLIRYLVTRKKEKKVPTN